MRIATIDVGTNTAQLLVAAVVNGTIRRLHVDNRFVRLGEGVDAHGRINEPAQERLVEALQAHQAMAREWEADTIVVGATSAWRDATNRDAVRRVVKEATGLSVDILSGKDEATWTFAAARDACPDVTGPAAVIDIGGGSTEIIVGTDPTANDDAITYRRSLDMGTVRFTERFFKTQPPDPASVREAADAIDTILQKANPPVDDAVPLIGTAGTVVALALVEAGPEASPEHLLESPPTLEADTVRQWRERLMALSFDEVMALHPEAMHGRADVFPMGVLILDRFMAQFGISDCRVSPYQLRHGLALRWQAERRAAQSR